MFALCTFAGLYWGLQSRWILAALALAASVSIRATGVFSTAVLAWMVLLPDGKLSKVLTVSFMNRLLGPQSSCADTCDANHTGCSAQLSDRGPICRLPTLRLPGFLSWRQLLKAVVSIKAAAPLQLCAGTVLVGASSQVDLEER